MSDEEKSREELLAELRVLRAVLADAAGKPAPGVSEKGRPTGPLAEAADEFGDLLTVINGYADLLLQMLPSVDPAHELVAAIHKAGARAAELTRMLLDHSLREVPRPLVVDPGK